jgi:hypothetical protein
MNNQLSLYQTSHNDVRDPRLVKRPEAERVDVQFSEMTRVEPSRVNVWRREAQVCSTAIDTASVLSSSE